MVLSHTVRDGFRTICLGILGLLGLTLMCIGLALSCLLVPKLVLVGAVLGGVALTVLVVIDDAVSEEYENR